MGQAPGAHLGSTALLTAACAATGAAMGIQIPVSIKSGMAQIELEVGTPPQRVSVGVDTTSPWLWVPQVKGTSSEPEHKHKPDDKHNHSGFDVKESKTVQVGDPERFSYMDGLHVTGDIITDTVRLGRGAMQLSVEAAPLLLAENLTDAHGFPFQANNQKFSGRLGLECRSREEASPEEGVDFWGLLAGTSTLGQASIPGDKLDSFFVHFWRTHPEVAKTFLLSFGAVRPSMTIGEQFREGARAQGGLRFLADTFTRRSDQWYTSVRAIGLSMASGSLIWNFDFNQLSSAGAPALLDSGLDGIRLGHILFEHVLGSLLDGGCELMPTQTINCPCDAGNLEATFPSFSLSLEALENVRILGLDAGADVRACIPPYNYVVPSARAGRCDVLIMDGGREHKSFGLEAIVLGMPFFRSVTVAFDHGRRMLGVGAAAIDIAGSIGYNPPPATTAADGGEALPAELGSSTSPKICNCADPKNWWQTGHRFSPLRVVVVLVGAAMVLAYVHIGFSPSPSAESIRNQLGSLIRPDVPQPPAQNPPPGRTTPDQNFIQMAGGPE